MRLMEFDIFLLGDLDNHYNQTGPRWHALHLLFFVVQQFQLFGRLNNIKNNTGCAVCRVAMARVPTHCLVRVKVLYCILLYHYI